MPLFLARVRDLLRRTGSVTTRPANTGRADELDTPIGAFDIHQSIARTNAQRFGWPDLKTETEPPPQPYAIGVGAEKNVAPNLAFLNVRPDENIERHSPPLCHAYIFNLTNASTTFGWQGVLSSQGHMANAALAAHLRICRRKKVKTVLLHDGNASQRCFFTDFLDAFDDSVGC